MTHFAIAGVQMHIGMRRNVEEMQHRLDLLMHLYPWVQMVLFSELASYGPSLDAAQPKGGDLEQAFAEMARKHGVWLLPGSYFEAHEGAVYNMTPVINPAGEVVARYRKMFPFTPYEAGVTPGREVCVFDVDGVGRFAVAICYDIWFPELLRTVTSMGAEVILSPVMAHFTDRDADLAVARAASAMFQSYVFHINGLGAGGNGQSLVMDPAGRVLHQSAGQEELIPIEIDLGMVRRQRERGLRTMGQPLKSFRDCTVDFPVYNRATFDFGYLNSLGPLEKPKRPETPAAVTSAAVTSSDVIPPVAPDLAAE